MVEQTLESPTLYIDNHSNCPAVLILTSSECISSSISYSQFDCMAVLSVYLKGNSTLKTKWPQIKVHI